MTISLIYDYDITQYDNYDTQTTWEIGKIYMQFSFSASLYAFRGVSILSLWSRYDLDLASRPKTFTFYHAYGYKHTTSHVPSS